MFRSNSTQTDSFNDSSGLDSISVRDRQVAVGGVQRPSADVAPVAKVSGSPYDSGAGVLREWYGDAPRLKSDANATVAAVSKAIDENTSLEQISPAKLPGTFDKQAYLADPRSYLQKHVPSRAFASAQPGAGVARLKPASNQSHFLRQGESIRLAVTTEAGMPATFTSFDLGVFDNGLSSITVAADKNGMAQANFIAAPGKVGEVNILAASPVAAEQVTFQVWIAPPSK